jgi:hypothetical protein
MELKSFELTGTYIDTNLKDFGQSVINLINVSSQVTIVEIKALKFKSGTLLPNYINLSLKDIIINKVPIIDYFIYNSLDENMKKHVHWTQDSSRKMATETQVGYAILFIYFMVMTRNKAMIKDDEEIPEFLIRFMKIKMTVDEVKSILSNNDLNLFNHHWVKSIEIDNLSIALKNRLKKGISGMRLFSIFKDYPISNKINEKMKLLCTNIKKLAIEGPYWEMHNLFQPEELSVISINANLLNLILVCYDEETIKLMVNNRSLFRYPTYNQRAVQFEMWNDDFFNLFKSKLFNS